MNAESTSTMNALLAITLLDNLLARAQQVSGAILQARKEGRDITDEELDRAVVDDNKARAMLEASIAKARAEGR